MRHALVVLFVLSAAAASAQQPVVNPTNVAFDHNDFAGVDSYVLGYFSSATAAAPVQEAAVSKPANCSPCVVSMLPSRPTAFQNWWVGVRAVAGAVSSPWSNLAPFVRSPAAPTNVRAQ